MATRQPVIWASLRAFMFLCGILEHRTAVKLGRAVGRAVELFSPRRADRARSRVVKMLGVPDAKSREIIHGSYEHFGMALVEFIRLPRMYPEIDRFVSVKGEEHIRRALSLGKGAIFLSAHIGCWEYGAAICSKHGIPMNAIGAEQRDDRITQTIADLRSGASVKPVGKGLDLRAAIECLRKNEVLAVLLDQDAKDSGVLSPFLGHLASTPVGPIKLASKLGSQVLPAHIIRDGDGTHMTLVIDPPLEGRDGRPFGEDVRFAVDRCNEVISGWIRDYPEQWMWMYPRWESTLNDK
jgi:KDO2-lipid IV(A) lauroyltransferase